MQPKLKIDALQENQQLTNLLDQLGWWGMQTEYKRKEVLKDAPINSFILAKDIDSGDIILSFVNKEKMIKEQTIYILESDPRWCFKNGSNHVYHFLPELIADVLDCKIKDIKPIQKMSF